MGLMIDLLTEQIRDSIHAAGTTREEWEQALDQAFGRREKESRSRGHLVRWEIDGDLDGEGLTPAEQAARIWRQTFGRGPLQPSAEEACVFSVADKGRWVEIDLSDEEHAYLFVSAET